MNFNIKGDSDCPIVQIVLERDESIKIEKGAMVYMANVELEGKMNSRSGGLGGILSAVGRSITSGESMFITRARATSERGIIGIAPAIPGKITDLKVGGSRQYCLNTGAFVACDETVTYNMIRQDLGKAIFGGTGGLFVMKTSGEGDILISSFGDILEINVTSGLPITIDNTHVVAWDAELDYRIKVASGTFGFMSGEGLVNEFHGNGKVYIQSRNLASLADALIPYLPTNSD